MRPTLSIVIPTKNEEKYLPSLLDSILNQKSIDPTEIPIIIADNNSTDSTLNVIFDYVSKGLSISTVQGGLPAAGRNNAAKMALSDYILFLDADVCINEDCICKLQEAFSKNGKSCYAISAHAKNNEFPFELMWIGYNFFLKFRLIGNAVGGFGVCVERKRFLEIGGFDETINTHEDVEIGRRFKVSELKVINSVVYVDSRRFRRDGFWKVFGMYTYIFFLSLFTKKYNTKSNNDYFKKDFS